jgi:hypothetical protein
MSGISQFHAHLANKSKIRELLPFQFVLKARAEKP